MKKGTLLFLIFLMIAMAGALVLLNQNQDTRKGATFANTSLFILPSDKINGNINETISAQVWFLTEGGAKVDGVQAKVCYGKELNLTNSGVVVNTEAGFENNPIFAVGETNATQTCSTIVVTSKSAVDSLTTTAKAMTLNFTAVSAGSGSITINKDASMVTGDNSASATDKTLAITSVAGTTYEIKETILTGDEPILNYKVTFSGVKVGDGKCAVDWPLQIIALGGGESKVYSEVKAAVISSGGSLIEYKGSLPLVGFNHLTDVAVFIKGPKHMQMKYATQDQKGRYDTAGGKLILTKSVETSILYNFTGYPLLPGDLVGNSISDSPNGEINGVDFAYIKSLDKNVVYDDGTNVKGDLDGNCAVNSKDVSLFKISLEEKQSELY